MATLPTNVEDHTLESYALHSPSASRRLVRELLDVSPKTKHSLPRGYGQLISRQAWHLLRLFLTMALTFGDLWVGYYIWTHSPPVYSVLAITCLLSVGAYLYWYDLGERLPSISPDIFILWNPARSFSKLDRVKLAVLATVTAASSFLALYMLHTMLLSTYSLFAAKWGLSSVLAQILTIGIVLPATVLMVMLSFSDALHFLKRFNNICDWSKCWFQGYAYQKSGVGDAHPDPARNALWKRALRSAFRIILVLGTGFIALNFSNIVAATFFNGTTDFFASSGYAHPFGSPFSGLGHVPMALLVAVTFYFLISGLMRVSVRLGRMMETAAERGVNPLKRMCAERGLWGTFRMALGWIAFIVRGISFGQSVSALSDRGFASGGLQRVADDCDAYADRRHALKPFLLEVPIPVQVEDVGHRQQAQHNLAPSL